jgi:hypothetical protein
MTYEIDERLRGIHPIGRKWKSRIIFQHIDIGQTLRKVIHEELKQKAE